MFSNVVYWLSEKKQSTTTGEWFHDSYLKLSRVEIANRGSMNLLINNQSTTAKLNFVSPFAKLKSGWVGIGDSPKPIGDNVVFYDDGVVSYNDGTIEFEPKTKKLKILTEESNNDVVFYNDGLVNYQSRSLLKESALLKGSFIFNNHEWFVVDGGYTERRFGGRDILNIRVVKGQDVQELRLFDDRIFYKNGTVIYRDGDILQERKK